MQLGSYDIIEKIASGGMAEIFLAKHRSVESFQRTLVIKRILPEYSQNPEFVESFLNEARLSALLNHPNIAQIYDLGMHSGTYFIAMEYVRGYDLGIVLRQARKNHSVLPLPVALSIYADVCEGLDYAHHAEDSDGQNLGVVHRDVTPSNVIVATRGQAKLVDFGIAKATSRSDHKTKTGTIKGKMAYLAPEQVMGYPIDQRVDVFACGIMLFEVLTSKNPFRGETDYQSLQLVMHGEVPPLASVRPDVPAVFDQIIKRALQRSADDRYPSCRDLLADVEKAAREAGIVYSHRDVEAHLRTNKEELKSLTATTVGQTASDLSGTSVEISSARDKTRSEVIAVTDQDTITEDAPGKKRTWAWVAAACILGIAGTLLFSQWQQRPKGEITQIVPDTFISIETDPAGAQVLVNGVMQSGRTPMQVHDVSVGKSYALEIVLAGYENAQSSFVLQQAGTHWVTTKLVPATPKRPPPRQDIARQDGPRQDGARADNTHQEPTKRKDVVASPAPDAQTPGRLVMAVKPWGSIEIDGKRIGDTPIAPRMLAPGAHQIVIENTELKKRVVKQIMVAPGQEVVVRENLMVD